MGMTRDGDEKILMMHDDEQMYGVMTMTTMADDTERSYRKQICNVMIRITTTTTTTAGTQTEHDDDDVILDRIIVR